MPHVPPLFPEVGGVGVTIDCCITCFSFKQNGNHLYEMHEGDIIFSANQGDSSMEDEDLQAKEIKEANTARSKILKRWPVFR